MMDDLGLYSEFIPESYETIMPDDGDTTHIITFFSSEGYTRIPCVRGEMVEFSFVEYFCEVIRMILCKDIL